MAPVATDPDRNNANGTSIQALKSKLIKSADEPAFNPFYSPPDADDGNDDYEYAQYKVCVCCNKPSRSQIMKAVCFTSLPSQK